MPCARVNNFAEVFAHPQIVARGMVKTVEHPRLGTMKATRNPVLLDHDGPDMARPSPMLGEHSEEILRELGYAPAAIEELAAAGVTKLATAGGGEGDGGGIAVYDHLRALHPSPDSRLASLAPQDDGDRLRTI